MLVDYMSHDFVAEGLFSEAYGDDLGLQVIYGGVEGSTSGSRGFREAMAQLDRGDFESDEAYYQAVTERINAERTDRGYTARRAHVLIEYYLGRAPHETPHGEVPGDAPREPVPDESRSTTSESADVDAGIGPWLDTPEPTEAHVENYRALLAEDPERYEQNLAAWRVLGGHAWVDALDRRVRGTPAPRSDAGVPAGEHHGTGSGPGQWRQLPEGYFLGSLIESPGQVDRLYEMGIRAVISAEFDDLTQETRDALGARMDWYNVGHDIRRLNRSRAEAIIALAERYEPQEMFVHCEHGKDRTGTIAAFLLVVEQGMSVEDAFYAVISRDEDEVDALGDTFDRLDEQHGYDLERREMDRDTGNYSWALVEPGSERGLSLGHDRRSGMVDSTVELLMDEEQLAAWRERLE